MELSLTQAKERIKNPPNRKAVQEAFRHEERVKLHTKTVDTREKASSYFNNFLRWVKDGIKLQADKYAVFEAMCQFPLPTTSLCDDIFLEFQRIFSASDSVNDVEVSDASMEEDFEDYLTDKAKVRNYFRTKGFKAYQTQPACLYVVDMPAMQTGPRPDPYFYKVPIAQVVDMEVIEDKIQYVIFKTSPERFVVIDGSAYRVFIKRQTANPDDLDYVLETDNPHALGYCPATFLIHDPLYDEEDNSPIARRSAISANAGDFDWLLFYKIGVRMYETYGVFPILTVPESDCSFVDQATQTPCTNGYVSYTDADGKPNAYACPACKQNNLVGPGTVFTKPVPKSKDDPELKSPVELTPPDIPSLKYVTEKIDYLEWEIYKKCVGSNDETVNKTAVNEQQVQSNAEGKRNILMKIKRDFEITEKFIIDTMGLLRYGPFYVGSNINYGEDFLLYNEADLITQYEQTKKAGLPTFMLADKKATLQHSTTRNNLEAQQRNKILNLLEPWTELSLNECITFQLAAQYPENFLLKSDFAKFVSKFEMENGDIVEWGSAIDFDTKIKKINEKLQEYVREQTAKAKPIAETATSSSGRPGNAGQPGTGSPANKKS